MDRGSFTYNAIRNWIEYLENWRLREYLAQLQTALEIYSEVTEDNKKKIPFKNERKFRNLLMGILGEEGTKLFKKLILSGGIEYEPSNKFAQLLINLGLAEVYEWGIGKNECLLKVNPEIGYHPFVMYITGVIAEMRYKPRD